jgi:hypothetical protein
MGEGRRRTTEDRRRTIDDSIFVIYVSYSFDYAQDMRFAPAYYLLLMKAKKNACLYN